MPKIERLLIVRLSAMGDVLHALPAVTALRDAFPAAFIGWVIEERWAELICSQDTPRCGPRMLQRPLVDRVHVVNTRAWRKAVFSDATWSAFLSSITELRAEGYEAAVDFQGAMRSSLLARLSGAPLVYGYAQPRENAASMFYTRQVQTKSAHVVDQNLWLARAVAQKDVISVPAELPRDPATESSAASKLNARNMKSFAILNPGAGWGAKQWPAERYGEVARCLAEWGYGSLVNFGPGEGILARAVEATSDGAAEGISCSLSLLIALTRRASLFIGGDTGPMHLAAALGVPVVGLFGPTNPVRNGPCGRRSVVLRSESSITSHSRRKDPEPGLLEITPEQVVVAAKKLLGAPRHANLV